MAHEEIKKLERNQKQILLYVYWNELVLSNSHQLLNQSCKSLVQRGLIEVHNEVVVLTALGNRIVEAELLDKADLSIGSVEELLASLQNQKPAKSFKVKKLGKKQNIFLNYIAQNPLEVTSEYFENIFILTLKENGFLEFGENQMKITDAGLATINDPINELDESLKSEIPSVILNAIGIKTNKLTKKETMFLQFLNYESPRPLKHIRKATQLIPSLEQKGFLEIIKSEVQITFDGKTVLNTALQDSKYDFSIEELSQYFLSVDKMESEEEFLQKSNEFLELRKKGLTLEAIGGLHGITRERVRQILARNPDLEKHLQEEEEAKILAEKEKEEKKKQEFLENSLACKYPEQVAELWDYEKNADLKPEEVPANSTLQEIWLKCPKDGFSWRKSAYSISYHSWSRFNASGCPKCAGRTQKAKKQPLLSEAYFDFVVEYWDFEKNELLGLNPEKISSGSNYKAWLKCPKDGNEWQAIIGSTVIQQWSKGNAGCRVCNGTHLRKVRVKGEWKKAGRLLDEFSDVVAKYWDYEKNGELGLKPSEITIGSSRKAWFKCPIDDYEWQASISMIARISWKNGRSGCPACRGWVVTDKTALINLYPEFVEKYWDFERNNKIGLLPNELTKGTNKEAWFKCPIDGYEWKVRIADITGSSWKLGNSGCARCFGWTTEAIRQFIASLKEHIPNLTQSERYKIFEQSGILGTTNAESLKIVKDIIKGKLTGQKLREVIQGKQIESIEPSQITVESLDANSELNSVIVNTQNPQNEFDYTEETEETVDLPKVRIQKSLEFLSSKIVASSDQEAIDFFVASRRNRIWAEVFEDESAVEGIESFADDGYGRQVRDQFLDEYNQARDMQIPNGWNFRIDGRITPPNLMQKVAAVRLKNQKRMLNLSLTGTGKTIGGILSSRIINANLTLIICPLDTINNWHSEIKNVFPDSKVTTKNFNPYWLDAEDGHHFIILNHEMFQQPTSASNIKQLLDRYKIDLIIVDEIHRCKQRSEDPSKRRQMVLAVGVDGFQRVCDRLILNIPPWTSAELEQLEGRLNRQGQIHDTLTIIFPITFGTDGEDYWSWDEGRLARLQNKQTIADAAVDGVMPEGQLRTKAQAFRDLRKWLDRLKDGEQKAIVRPKIFVPLPDADESDVKRRIVKYGDFSRMNARWNTSYSSTTYQRLQNNPEEWMQYHTLYQDARKKWEIVPYQETIKWLEKRSNLVVGDFGCGEAIIAKKISEKHTIHNFDYVAINDSVIECDISKVPLLDEELDVAVFNLSLMGKNYKDYLVEAKRTLKLDGQLLIYEVESQSKDIEDLASNLESLGFNIIENYINWKFRFIRAIKSE